MNFQSPRVARAVAAVSGGAAYDRAPSADSTYLYRLSAAHACGVYEPFDADATELNDWLDRQQAGKRLASDVWAAFMDATP